MGRGGNGSGARAASAQGAFDAFRYAIRRTTRPGTSTGVGSTAAELAQVSAWQAGIFSGFVLPV